MDRRRFLKLVGGCAAGVMVSGCGSSGGFWGSENSGQRPNILFCITDDQSWAHAGAYGSKMVNTPAFDRVAREGVLFNHAFVSAPSCCPSRGSALTGQAFYRLREGAQNHSTFPPDLKVYPNILAEAGYHVGFTGKGWGPGDFKFTRWRHNPAGRMYASKRQKPQTSKMSPYNYAANFQNFLDKRPEGAPFCFWYGAIEPHRPFEPGSGLKAGKKLEDAEVPPFLPDCAEVRTDILDYALEVEWADKHLAQMLQALEAAGELDDTIIVVTGDNGMAFPRAKANLYDYGTRMPLAIRWRERVKAGRVVDDFVSFTDFAPTFLEAAGIKPLAEMTGRSFMNVLLSKKSGQVDASRDHVITGRERHHPAAFLEGGQSFPCRAIRTKDWLYIRNYKPGRSAAGDAPAYNDVDGGLTKDYMAANHESGRNKELFELAFGPRPAEELYDLKKDPDQMNNVAADARYAAVKTKLAKRLQKELVGTEDPRAMGNGDVFDEYPVLTGPYRKVPAKRRR